MTPKRFAALGLAAGLLSGGIAGVAFGIPGLAGAQTGGSTVAPETPVDPGAATHKGKRVRDALAPLVADGTLTPAQADAVTAALEAARTPRRGPGGHRTFKGGPRLEAAAATLGMTTGELRTALRGGKTLAQVANDKGVSPEAVVDAIVAGLKARLAQEVTEGTVTQEQADRKIAKATERTRAVVNGEAPGRGAKLGRHGPRGGRPAAPEGSTERSFSDAPAGDSGATTPA